MRSNSSAILLLAFVVLLTLASFFQSNAWITVLAVLLSVILVSTEILVANRPSSIRAIQQANCFRRDGSHSQGRESLERQSQNRLRRNIGFAICVVALPTAFLLWMTDRSYVPVSIGFDAITSFRFSEEGWKQNVVDEGARFDRWHENSIAGTDVDTHKQILWNFWPLFAVLGVAWLAGCAIFVQRSYLYFLNQQHQSAKHRAQNYFWRDLGRASSGVNLKAKVDETNQKKAPIDMECPSV